jgi:hypothetical protein
MPPGAQPLATAGCSLTALGAAWQVLSELATAAQVLDVQLGEAVARLAGVLQAFLAPHMTAFAAIDYQAVRSFLPSRALSLCMLAVPHASSAPGLCVCVCVCVCLCMCVRVCVRVRVWGGACLPAHDA